MWETKNFIQLLVSSMEDMKTSQYKALKEYYFL